MSKKTTEKLLMNFQIILVAAALCLVASTGTAKDRQYKIEAAFLYNFFNYITWPGYSSPRELQNPTICIYGDDPVTRYLEYIKLKVAEERTLRIQTVYNGDSTDGCNMFFVRRWVSDQMVNSLGESVLTVFKPDDPIDRGGMIELTEDEERITIRINKAMLEKNGFHTSSRLLELAKVK